MAKANQARISGEVRHLLNEELGSHAEAHVRHNIQAKAEFVQERSRAGNFDSGRYRVVESLPTYRVTVSGAARSGITNPESTGTTLLVRWDSGILGKVEVSKPSGKLRLTRVSSGAMASELEEVILRIRGRSTRPSKAEIRILSLSAIHLVCVWKHWPNNRGDRLAPVMQNFIGLRRGRDYSLSHVNAVVRRAATNTIISWYERQRQTDKTQPK